jgi:hypothetical protein
LLAGWVLFNAGWHWVVVTSMPFIVILYIVFMLYHKKTLAEKAINTSA